MTMETETNSPEIRDIYLVGFKRDSSKKELKVVILQKFQTIEELVSGYKSWLEFAHMLNLDEKIIPGIGTRIGRFRNLKDSLAYSIRLDEARVLEQRYMN